MRISDWSSDVCSSDLWPRRPAETPVRTRQDRQYLRGARLVGRFVAEYALEIECRAFFGAAVHGVLHAEFRIDRARGRARTMDHHALFGVADLRIGHPQIKVGEARPGPCCCKGGKRV